MRTVQVFTQFRYDAAVLDAKAQGESLMHVDILTNPHDGWELTFEDQAVRDAADIDKQLRRETMRATSLDMFATVGELADALLDVQ